MLLQLQKGIIYGPVRSRRLGSSLGINLLPLGQKVCSFNCLYCQYGWTDCSKLNSNDYPGVHEVLDNVEHALRSLANDPAYLTFSGNGEPTLHPQFLEIVEGLVELRNAHSPGSRTAILSNSSTVHHQEIRKALGKLDVRIMKLDVGTPHMLSAYNLPCGKVKFSEMVAGLCNLNNIIVQSLFTAGEKGNLTRENLVAWLEQLKRISPHMVQIYSLDRGCPSEYILKVGHNELVSIKSLVEDQGIKADIY